MANSTYGKAVLKKIRYAYFIGLSIIILLILVKQIVTPMIMGKLKSDTKLVFLASKQALVSQQIIEEVQQNLTTSFGYQEQY